MVDEEEEWVEVEVEVEEEVDDEAERTNEFFCFLFFPSSPFFLRVIGLCFLDRSRTELADGELARSEERGAWTRDGAMKKKRRRRKRKFLSDLLFLHFSSCSLDQSKTRPRLFRARDGARPPRSLRPQQRHGRPAESSPSGQAGKSDSVERKRAREKKETLRCLWLGEEDSRISLLPRPQPFFLNKKKKKKKQLEAIYHSAVLLRGEEIYFGAGISRVRDGVSRFGSNRLRVLDLGETSKTREEVEGFLKRAAATSFSATSYNLLTRNCNHFSDEFATFLTGVSNCVPREIVSLP